MPLPSFTRQFLPPPFVAKAAQDLAPPGAKVEKTSAPDIVLDVEEVDDKRLTRLMPFSADPRLNRRLENLVNVVGVNAVSSRSGVDRAFNFSEGTMLGLSFGDQFYDYDSDYVKESEIRRACTGKLIQQSAGRSVVWLETAGVMEAGYGMQGTLMLGDFTSLTGAFSYGFSAGSVLRFRTSQAFALSSEENRAKLLKNTSFRIPRTVEEAKIMPFGSEVEITGQGKANVDTTLSLRAGPSVALATAGATLEAGNTSHISGELSLNVTALDGYRKVRVTLRALDKESTAFSAAFRAGLVFPPGSLQPAWGAGLLKYLIASLNYRTIEELVNAYTTFTARYAYSISHQGTIIASYDFDLENPAAQKAYEKIVRLNSSMAHTLSQNRTSGVTKVIAKETETSSANLIDLTLLGEKLYLRETLKSDRSGNLVQDNKEIMAYKDTKYKKRTESWFMGLKNIEWQAVFIHDKKTDEKIPYFRLHFEKKDYDGSAIPKIDAYFRFANSMGISSSELNDNLPDTASDYNQILSNAEEVNTDIDIYFTNEGIREINTADKKKAYEAYVIASGEILPPFKDPPFVGNSMKALRAREFIREFRSIEKKTRKAGATERERIIKDYRSLTGRELGQDANLAGEAEKFADAIETLTDITDPKQISQFFPQFGEKNGFNFMQTISAMQKLAKRENTLVHSMAMSGGGITLQSRDEGTLEHPREMVMDVLTRTV